MKLAFITDFHLEATPGDFHFQTYYVGGHAAIAHGLRNFIINNRVDILLFGGDMTHNTSDAEISRFLAIFHDFPCPIYLCLGNHDLARTPEVDHIALWKSVLAAHPSFTLAPYFAQLDGVDLIAFNPQWADAQGIGHFCWSSTTPCNARINSADLARLDATLSKNPGCPAIVITHEGLEPIPTDLSGLPEPIHVPAPEYVGPLNALLDRHPRARLVLSGHNHVTLAIPHNGRVHAYTGSTSEYPCDVRLIEITPAAIRVTTHPLIEWPRHIPWQPAPRGLWASGRESDRTFAIPL